ncbi:putative cysteine-rich receptor-like protein kinase 9 [Corylus avellana]|uniref:putative cysteine-rich receptor-like protein kinase 9 n=1 Tax=Corylus avellana TaxID=13451 RepID=UPI00286CC1B6|nr:putative cysteine-rich receptor-like protein kinase 9 [Corylus avellana]
MGYNLRMTILFLSMLISFLCQTPTEAAPIVYNHNCTNTTTLTANNNYQSNLLCLLTYLSSKATCNLEFYKASVGNSIDTVYGLFLCLGNLPALDRQNCVAVATKEIVGYSAEEKVAVAWYYSNLYIFSTMASEPASSILSTDTVSEPNRFDKLVMATMNGLASSFSNVASRAKKFGTKEANSTASQTLYTLVQCTPDLSSYDCNRCLQIAMKNLSGCCAGKKSGRVMLSSCYLCVGAIVEALFEMNDLGVDEVGENGENVLEVGEEGRVVEGPGAGLVAVPFGEREGVGESEPMAVDLEEAKMEMASSLGG